MVAVALFAPGALIAQTFNAEVRISSLAGPSIHPTVAAVGTNVYVVWVENFDLGAGYKGDIYFSRSTDSGATFSAPIALTNTPTRNDRLPLIAAGGSQVHVFWTDDPVAGDVFYRRSTDSGAIFFPEVQMTPADGHYSRPTGAVVDSGGLVHFAFYDDRAPANSYGQIFYQCSADSGATFSAATNITQFDGAVDNDEPRLAQGSDGTLYLLFRTSRAGLPFGGFPPFDQYMMRSSAPVTSCPTVNWLHPPQKVSVGLPEEFANTFGGNITAGANNVLHAAYWSDKLGTNLVYRRGFPNGKGWETPIDISSLGANHLQWDGTVPELTGFGLGEDVAGKVHVVFGENNHLREGFQSGPLYYRCSNDGGVTWVPRQLATGQAETAQPRAVYANNRFHIVWMDWRDNNTGAEIYYRNVTTGACAAAAVSLLLSSNSIVFGAESMGTTSLPQAVTVTNTGSGTLTVSNVSASSTEFAQTNDCGSVAAGASCTINVTFTPAPTAGAINSTSSVSGPLTITSNASGSPHTVNLTGIGEKSLVTHFYRSILRRAPDSGGKAFWVSEAVRMQGLAANVNETWYAMATFFYFSSEYASFNRDDTGFVTDLYYTFFNRPPDAAGLSYWTGQIAQGMPREVVLVSFMFSPEFVTFTQSIFGNTAARAEIDTVVDFYRGMLSRLPDTGGFNSWVGSFRTAQCQGAGAVYATVESISSSFANSGEYLARNRTNAQYVGDLYNAFLRRGGDLGGVQFWINQLNTGGKTRNTVRQDFISSGEFTNRVNAIIAQGCFP